MEIPLMEIDDSDRSLRCDEIRSDEFFYMSQA